MPIYEFECSNGHRFEKYAKMSDSEAPARCPECKRKGQRVYSQTGVPVLKRGSGGFHKPTD